jgi:adenylate cyclase
VAAIEELLPPLAIVLKSCALTRIAQTLVETYLGRDAGRRVLGGRISRGAVERISTALWFSDLRDFTRIAEAVAPDQLIPFLGEHAETVIDAIHAAGGDVLKLIGDGTLAIFSGSDPAEACRAALAAAERAITAIAVLGERRASYGLASTKLYLGLHFGDVFFGNIGSRERLDFTVVGPAVNEVSRIASMCRSLDQPVLISSCSPPRSAPMPNSWFRSGDMHSGVWAVPSTCSHSSPARCSQDATTPDRLLSSPCASTRPSPAPN